MDIDAFRYMRRGLEVDILSQQDTSLLAAIHQENGKKERALLLIHGFSSSPAVYRLLLPILSQSYDAISCPLLIGHGDSIDSFEKAKANRWIHQIEQAYHSLAKEYKQIEVLGLSLGGLLACHLSQSVQLSHLYLLAPAIDLQLSLNWSIKVAKTLRWFGFRRIRTIGGDLHRSEHCEIVYRQLPLTSIIEMLTLVKEFKFSIPNCPTELFLGRHDKVVASARVAARFAQSKQVKIHWLANSAHVLPLDGDIDYILRCIRQH